MKDETVKLTQMVQLHGCSCKLRERELDKLLETAGIKFLKRDNILIGPGDDAGAIKIRADLAYVTHLDFFTPIIDDPYLYGKIAACNSASDVFVKGAVDDIGVLVIMGGPSEVSIEVLQRTLEGVRDFCKEVNAEILGGHTIVNPWPILGASVTATMHPKMIIRNSNAKPGDILILTKPLGTQPAMGAVRALEQMKDAVTSVISEKQVTDLRDFATKVMTTPNNYAGEAMLEVSVNASTDITGFGLMGQAAIMAKRSGVDIEIRILPVMEGTHKLSLLFGYGLDRGESAETSGGALISVPEKRKDRLISALEKRKVPAYEIGVVNKGTGHAVLAKEKKIIEITSGAFIYRQTS